MRRQPSEEQRQPLHIGTIMQKFKAVIFDMDGLLIDSEKLYYESFLSACSYFQIGDLSDVFKSCIGTNSEMGKAILKKGLRDLVSYEEFSKRWDHIVLEMIGERPIPLKKGANELLSSLKLSNIPMAVATSSDTDLAKARLSDSKILEYFEFVVGGDQVTKGKPDPEIYLAAANKFNVSPYDCLALEDSSNGVKSAVAAGMTVVQVPDIIQPNEQTLALGHIVLGHLAEVLHYSF